MSGNIMFTVDDIKSLIDKVADKGIANFSLKTDEFDLIIEGKTLAAQMSKTYEDVQNIETVNTRESEIKKTSTALCSPIVGTFYASPAPGKEAFVKVGSTVNKGDVIYIVESMKLMNEVNSEYDGVITEILAVDGQGLEYSQEVMRIDVK